MAEDTAEVSKHSCVRGYHVYKDVWRVAIDEELVRQRKQGNVHDIYPWTRVAFTCLLASMISLGCKTLKRGPLGSGRLSRCLTYHRMDMTAARWARGDYSAEIFRLI